VADPDQTFWGIHIGWRQNVLLLKYPRFSWQWLGLTQKWLRFIGQESGYFCGWTTRSFRKSPKFKNSYIVNLQNFCIRLNKIGHHFSQSVQ